MGSLRKLVRGLRRVVGSFGCALCFLLWLGVGAYGLWVCIVIAISLFGRYSILVWLIAWPELIAYAPFYALFAWHNWVPLAACVLEFILFVVGASLAGWGWGEDQDTDR